MCQREREEEEMGEEQKVRKKEKETGRETVCKDREGGWWFCLCPITLIADAPSLSDGIEINMSLTICPQIHLPLLWRICTFMCASMLKDWECVSVCVSVYTWRFPCLYVDFVIYREQSLETFTFIAGWCISVLPLQTNTHMHTQTLWGAI